MPLRVIELMGPSGAGKTTLLRELQKNSPGAFVDDYNFFLFKRRTEIPFKWLTHFVDIKALLYLPLVLFSATSRKLFMVGFRLSLRSDFSWFRRLNIFRNFYKKLVIRLSCERFQHEAAPTVIFDEGLFQFVHMFFVSPTTKPCVSDIQSYLSDLPVPSLLVLVSAERADLYRNLEKRTDPPLGDDLRSNKVFVDQAVEAFELVKSYLRGMSYFISLASPPELDNFVREFGTSSYNNSDGECHE